MEKFGLLKITIVLLAYSRSELICYPTVFCTSLPSSLCIGLHRIALQIRQILFYECFIRIKSLYNTFGCLQYILAVSIREHRNKIHHAFYYASTFDAGL